MSDIRVHPDLWHRILADDLSATQPDGSLLINGDRFVSDPTVPENCVVMGDGDPKSLADEIERRARQDERNARYAGGLGMSLGAHPAGAGRIIEYDTDSTCQPPPEPFVPRGWHQDRAYRPKRPASPADAEALRKAQEKRQRKALKREEQERRTREGKGGGT